MAEHDMTDNNGGLAANETEAAREDVHEEGTEEQPTEEVSEVERLQEA